MDVTWCIMPLGKYNISPASKTASRIGLPISFSEKLADKGKYYIIISLLHLSSSLASYMYIHLLKSGFPGAELLSRTFHVQSNHVVVRSFPED